MAKRTAVVVLPGVDEREFEYGSEADLLKKACAHFGTERALSRLVRTDGGYMLDNVWARQRILLRDQQARIRDARALIVGAGALGSELAKDLAQIGFGAITLIDMDVVEYSNVSRGFYSPKDVGKKKAPTLARNISRMFPFCRIRPIARQVEQCPAKALDADVWLSAVDGMAVRIWLCEQALRRGVPLVDGGFRGLAGRAQVVRDGGACLACAIPMDRYAEVVGLRNSCDADEPGAIASFPTVSSVVAGVMANEAMKAVLGWPTMKGVFIADLKSARFQVQDVKRNPECFVCSKI